MHRSLTLLALATLSFTGLLALRKKHHERLDGSRGPKAKAQSLQAWEGEGGGLPDGGPGQTVDPIGTLPDVASRDRPA